jgi:hypothetical protein
MSFRVIPNQFKVESELNREQNISVYFSRDFGFTNKESSK